MEEELILTYNPKDSDKFITLVKLPFTGENLILLREQSTSHNIVEKNGGGFHLLTKINGNYIHKEFGEISLSQII